MSNELIKARSALAGINSLLKQQKVLPAVLALHDALGVIIRTPLMKSERSDFERSLENAVYQLNGDPNLRKIYPILLQYTPGEEAEVQGVLRELLGELQENAVQDARNLLAERESRKQEGLAKGRQLILEEQFDPAEKLFDKMLRHYHGDQELRVDIGEMFLEAGQFDRAFTYLNDSLHSNPDSAHLLNRIGMGLRKLGKCEEAEQCFLQALKLSKEDERLYFNLGRVYIDRGFWDKAEQAASKAMALNPDLEQARKMRDFAHRKQKG